MAETDVLFLTDIDVDGQGDALHGFAKALPEITLQRLDAAYRAWSANSRRAFRCDLALWTSWCADNGIKLSQATPGDVARWIRALASGEDRDGVPRAAASLTRYLAHVSRAYRLLDLADPTSDILVKTELKAARKQVGTRQQQAMGLRFKGDVNDLDGPPAPLSLMTLLTACKRGSYGRLDALALRNIALLRLAYDTALRRSEIVAIAVEHIEGPESDGAGRLFIPKSKSDREGEGAYAYLSPATMQAIAAWRTEGKIANGTLFRRIRTHFDGTVARVCAEGLQPGAISLIYKRLVRTAHTKGLLGKIGENELERIVLSISGHSIRVGVAQDNIAAGEDLGAIMQAYRWKDPRMVLRYGEKLAVRSGASARMAKRFEG